jgi:DNA-binding NarL/FixJ family response regulator
MGLHTGEPAAVDGDLHGRTVVKAARIAGLARGGEVLASTVVRELAGTEDGVGTDAWFEEEREVELRGMRGRHRICALGWEAEQRRATRVVVADDSAVVRDGVAAVLRENGIDVTATASDAESLYRAVNRHRPDVALVDIRMPPTGTDEGLVAAERLAESHPEMGVLVLSSHLEPGYALRLVEGCECRRGYLLKDRVTDIEVLLEAIRRIARGGSVVDPAIVEELVGAAGAGESLSALSDRERMVLRLVAQGMSDEGIAAAMGLALVDVEREVREIVEKLGLEEDGDGNTRVAAVLTYLEATAVGR